MPDPVDTLAAALADRYTIERVLGAGGMATVYLAHDVKHQRRVAIKVLRPELAAALGHDRFLREITTTANLRHPHILPLYDSGAAGAFLYYVMPYVEGESLRDRLTREKQLPLDDALQIAREVADALSYAHSRGVVHRDIKPENILLESGHAVVADFGIARALDAAGGERLTETGIAVGTPAYMSPEQAAGERDLDGRSDLYALGCVLYEMLAGQPPFTGPTAESLVHQHLTATPPPITQLRPAVPPAVSTALQRALAKAPADRFNPVAQFSDALRLGTATTEGPSHAGPGRPRDIRASAVLVALVVLAVATGLFYWHNRSAQGPSPTPSVAVLPFSDLSGDTTHYLGDGIAETLINALSQVPGLDVAARTSAFSFKGKTVDVREIGRQLRVGTVLEGSVQRSGDRLRITADLVNCHDGFHLWSKTFDRPAGDIFAVQDEVARAVVTALQGKLLADSTQPLARQGTDDPRAYDAYLLGRFYWNKRAAPDMVRAAEYFGQAIRDDSGYARAWAGLADAYTLFIPSEYDVPGINPDSILTLAEGAARRAVATDTLLGEGWTSLGEVLEYRLKWDEALRAFERGVALSPRYPTAHQWYAYDLMIRNRWDDAIREMERAKQLDPLSLVITVSLGAVYDGVERWDEAETMYRQAEALAPDHSLTHFYAFAHGLVHGDVEWTAYHYRRLLEITGTDSATAAAMEARLRDTTQRAPALRQIAREAADPYTPAIVARVLDGDDAMVAFLERLPNDPRRARLERATLAAYIGPRLHGNPKMRTALERLGYPTQAP
jgi:eukaryotic-like serine/threonine-protein kinase